MKDREKIVDHGLEVGFCKKNKVWVFMALSLQRDIREALMRACNCMGLLCTVSVCS